MMNSSDRPRTFNGDLQHLPAALLPLTQEARFVVWRWEWRARKGGGGKWTKPPYQARYPREPAKSNDPATWGNYQDAVAAVAAGSADGIGFMLKDASVGAVDLDHVRDPDTGELVGWAAALSAEADGAYREPTVSGGGLRLIGVARGPEIHRKFTFDRATGAGVELYRNCARYITISGLQLGECSELPVIDGLLDTLFARYSGTAQQANGHDFNEAGRQQSSID
jgi:primase-polymerase (primpol)-like protein